jgi:hypothetical protein
VTAWDVRPFRLCRAVQPTWVVTDDPIGRWWSEACRRRIEPEPESGSSVTRREWIVMTLRVLWGLSLALAAMLTGVGIELYADGAGPLISYPLVIIGIGMLPLASAGIERLTERVAASPE